MKGYFNSKLHVKNNPSEVKITKVGATHQISGLLCMLISLQPIKLLIPAWLLQPAFTTVVLRFRVWFEMKLFYHGFKYC